VTQDGGVVQRAPPVAVRLVDVGAVLQQELAGRQGVLIEKVSCSAGFHIITFSLHINTR